MTKERLFSTESELASLRALDGKDTIYTDVRTPGLRVRVSAKTGGKTFVFEYRRPGTRPSDTSPTKQKLAGIKTLKDARKRVAEIKAVLEAGGDPFAPPPPPPPPEPEPVKITVSYIAERYRTIKKPAAQDWRLIEKRILPRFGSIELTDLKTLDISEWHSGITKKVAVKDENGKTVRHEMVPARHQADRLLDVFRAMLNWAERQQLKPRHTNPCEFVQRNFSVLDTERHYDWIDSELERLAEVLNCYEREATVAHDNGHYMVSQRRSDGTIGEHMPGLWSILALRFLIITGVRKNEALKLRWDQIKEDRNVIEWVRNSRRRETKVIGGGQRAMLRVITGPLGDLLIKLKQIRVVGNPYVFVGKDRVGHLTDIHRIWYRIRDEAKLVKPDGERPRLHDLRHCYGQAAAEAGLHEKQIMAVMGHSTTRMSARYAKYGPNAHAAYAEAVASHISRKLGNIPSDVWASAAKRTPMFSEDERELRYRIFLLCVGLSTRGDAAVRMLSVSFSPVYEAAKGESLTRELWELIEPYMLWYRDNWDRCARLVKTVARAFVDKDLDEAGICDVFVTDEQFSRALAEFRTMFLGSRVIRRLKDRISEGKVGTQRQHRLLFHPRNS